VRESPTFSTSVQFVDLTAARLTLHTTPLPAESCNPKNMEMSITRALRFPTSHSLLATHTTSRGNTHGTAHGRKRKFSPPKPLSCRFQSEIPDFTPFPPSLPISPAPKPIPLKVYENTKEIRTDALPAGTSGEGSLSLPSGKTRGKHRRLAFTAAHYENSTQIPIPDFDCHMLTPEKLKRSRLSKNGDTFTFPAIPTAVTFFFLPFLPPDA